MSANFPKTGVIGYPVAQSLSPLIHKYWLRRYNIFADYQAVAVPKGMLKESIAGMVAEGFRGFNVTIPHKQDVMALCATLDDTARKVGAVNTVVVQKDGALHGMNTDSFGFAENLRQAGVAEKLEGGAALVLGAGGAARGVVHALQELGMSTIRLANRTREKAEQIGRDFSFDVIDWEERENAADGVALLVNTTALGMTGQPPLDFSLQHLPKDAAVCDIVYKPLQTPLLRDAAAHGNTVVTGIGMLLHQAQPAFQAWFGPFPEVDEELRILVTEKAG